MKALTLWEPYATLIAMGIKTIETRGWATSYRGPLLIHSAKRWTAEERAACDDAFQWLLYRYSKGEFSRVQMEAYRPHKTQGCILAVADLVDCPQMDAAPDEANAEFGFFGPGRYGWTLNNNRMLDEPVLARGRQQLWTPTDAVLAQLHKQGVYS